MGVYPLSNRRDISILGMSVLLLLIKNQLVFYKGWDMQMLINIRLELSILADLFKHFSHKYIQS